MDIEQLSEEIQFNFAQIARENPMMATVNLEISRFALKDNP